MVVRSRRCQHDFQIPGRIDRRRAPASVCAGLRGMDGAADTFATIGRDAIHFHRSVRHRTVGLYASGRAGDQPAQPDFFFRRDRDAIRLAAGDEFKDLAERPRMIRGLAMVDRAEHEIGGALEGRAFRGNPGRRARLADEAAVGLRIFVETIAAQCQERGARRHLAFALVQSAQERTAAIELAAGIVVPIKHAVIGYPAQHGVADIAAAAFDIAANGIAAARIADESHARGAGFAFQLLDRLAKLATLIFGGGFVRLRPGIVAARQRIGEIDREHAVARNAVGFHPPQCRDPQRRLVAIAVHEQNRRNLDRAGGRGRGLRQRSQAKIAGRQRQGRGAFQHLPSRYLHGVTPRYFAHFSCLI